MKKLIGYSTLFLTVSLASSSVMAQRPLGIDVSSFQGSINWTSAHGDGVLFAFAKATEGTYLQDADYHANMSNGKVRWRVLMGAYELSSS